MLARTSLCLRRLATSIRGPESLRSITTAHVLGIIGGGWVTVTLADSLFFELTPDASRVQVLRYLAITMLPIAVLARVLGPALDRFARGPRWFGVCSNCARCVCCLGLAATVSTLAFFVWAFALLIANKAFTASKFALMPSLVSSRELLVATNVRMAKWGAVSGALGVATGALLNHRFGTRPLLLFAAAIFLGAAWTMNRVTGRSTAMAPARSNTVVTAAEPRPSRRASVAAFPFIATRCGVGFFSFTCAFTLRRAGVSTTVLGALALCYAVGSFLGNILAPASRRRTGEEQMIAWTVGAATVACAAAALSGAAQPVVLVSSFILGFAAAHARQGFDSIVQSTSSATSRGRVFAYFETRSQLAWVVGALLATFFAIDLSIASMILAVGFCSALVVARDMFGGRATTYYGPPVLEARAFGRPNLARLRSPVVGD